MSTKPKTIDDVSDEPLTFLEMHKIVSQEVRALKENIIGNARAKTTCNQVGKMTALAKAEMEIIKLIGGKPEQLASRYGVQVT